MIQTGRIKSGLCGVFGRSLAEDVAWASVLRNAGNGGVDVPNHRNGARCF